MPVLIVVRALQDFFKPDCKSRKHSNLRGAALVVNTFSVSELRNGTPDQFEKLRGG